MVNRADAAVLFTDGADAEVEGLLRLTRARTSVALRVVKVAGSPVGGYRTDSPG